MYQLMKFQVGSLGLDKLDLKATVKTGLDKSISMHITASSGGRPKRREFTKSDLRESILGTDGSR